MTTFVHYQQIMDECHHTILSHLFNAIIEAYCTPCLRSLAWLLH